MKKITVLFSITIISICISARADNSKPDAMITNPDSITFATLDTDVDSDKPDLVTATIQKGKYKGAILHGELTHRLGQSDQYQLIFTSMTYHKNPKPIKISAYAIDADTARTALTNNVNDENFNRHGQILSTSFLQGNSESDGDVYSPHNSTASASKVKIGSGKNIGVLFVSKLRA